MNLLTEYFLLNWQPGTISIAMNGKNMVVRYGLFSGFTLCHKKALSKISNLVNKNNIDIPVITLRPVELIPPSLLGDKEILDSSIDWQASKYQVMRNILYGIYEV